VQAHPQSFICRKSGQIPENPAKICENVRKILENLDKLPEKIPKKAQKCHPTLFDFEKLAPNVCRIT